MKDLIIKKCLKCGALVEVLHDCTCNNCGIKCCNSEMVALAPNSTDAAVEKHLPSYERQGDKIVTRVNHVMEEEHNIEWIALVGDNLTYKKEFSAGDVAEVELPYIKGAKLYAYCNKHGLWGIDVE